MGVLPLLDAHADPDTDVILTDPHADMHLPDADSNTNIVLADPDAALVLPEPDLIDCARSGTCAGARHSSRDGLRRWALTAGGSCASGSFASAGSWAPSGGLPTMAMALEPPGNKPAGRHALPTRRRKLVTEHGVRFARFGLIGGGVFIAGLALQAGLTSGLHIPAFLSYLIQTVLSVEVSFLLNRLFTWRERGTSFWPSFWRYNVQKAITVVLNLLAYAGLLRLGVNYIMANVVLTAIFTVVNYVGGDRFVFTPETGRP